MSLGVAVVDNAWNPVLTVGEEANLPYLQDLLDQMMDQGPGPVGGRARRAGPRNGRAATGGRAGSSRGRQRGRTGGRGVVRRTSEVTDEVEEADTDETDVCSEDEREADIMVSEPLPNIPRSTISPHPSIEARPAEDVVLDVSGRDGTGLRRGRRVRRQLRRAVTPDTGSDEDGWLQTADNTRSGHPFSPVKILDFGIRGYKDE